MIMITEEVTSLLIGVIAEIIDPAQEEVLLDRDFVDHTSLQIHLYFITV